MEIGVVSFTYISLEQMPLLEEILSSNKDGIKQLNERYVLLCNDETNKFHHDCPMIEILKEDIYNFKDFGFIQYYENLKNVYGKELVDLLIIENKEIIQNKLINIINFAMNQIYKSDVIRVELSKFQQSWREKTSIPDLIYSTIGMNFDIIDQYLIEPQSYMIIKRRKCND
jgi:hypothetical protein